MSRWLQAPVGARRHQQAPAGTSRHQQVPRRTPEPSYVTLRLHCRQEGLWAISNKVNLIDKRELAVRTHQDVIGLVSFLKNRTEQRIASIQSDIVSTGSQWRGPPDTA